METIAHGPSFQKRVHVHIERTGEIRRIDACNGGAVYVLMDGIDESELFAADLDKDAYFVELVTTAENLNDNYRPIFRTTE
jgi:hypothetical protein